MVTEEAQTEFDPSFAVDPSITETEKPDVLQTYRAWILVGGGGALLGVILIIRHIRRKRRAAKEKEDIENEIS